MATGLARDLVGVVATDQAGNTDPTPASDDWMVLRRTSGTGTYRFEVLSPTLGWPSTVQAADAVEACAGAAGSSARMMVGLPDVRHQRRANGRTRLSGGVPRFAARNGLARLHVGVRRHGDWRFFSSHRVRVRNGAFRLTARVPRGQIRVRALVRCG